MYPFPLPYEPRWVAKLLRRDIHDLKVKITTKIKVCLGPSKASRLVPTEAGVLISEPGGLRNNKSTVSTAFGVVSTSSSLYNQPSLTSS
jgi:hypothetical protein